ncbi:MAG: bifunctional glutamate N-acetyltransferase/amino-acid acetyltransferase ArgJ [Syntrophomonadaceae bacterium]|nr:bifunctional glutamate N-acetyltransferase/amino-acid acetyltransferase ArgJ [Syntrophomonadaceae bacterium]
MKWIDGGVTAPQGFAAAAVAAGIKYEDRLDLAIIKSDVICAAAGVFTMNAVRAACVDIARAYLADGQAQAIVVNSGNANACTGEQGWEDTVNMAAAAAEALALEPMNVLVASTGVIGAYMPMEKVLAGIPSAAGALSADAGQSVARAIMTTDLVKKEVAAELDIDGVKVKIGAVAKGSGMIHPNMATMLCFITTDAVVDSPCLQVMLKAAVDKSFNMVSVDRDTSTNDMVLILANGKAGGNVISDPESDGGALLQQALDEICIKLARMIARDGEGATHLMEVEVKNAPDLPTARQIARAVTGSNLTKAALFGQDANWGRIFAAAGSSGAEFEPHDVDIYLGRVMVAQDGVGLVFDEAAAAQALQQDTIVITLDLKQGNAAATAWGCDLTYDYVKINGAYRT